MTNVVLTYVILHKIEWEINSNTFKLLRLSKNIIISIYLLKKCFGTTLVLDFDVTENYLSTIHKDCLDPLINIKSVLYKYSVNTSVYPPKFTRLC